MLYLKKLRREGHLIPEGGKGPDDMGERSVTNLERVNVDKAQMRNKVANFFLNS